MTKNEKIKNKQEFLSMLQSFSREVLEIISKDNSWTIKGFIDLYKNIYTISADTKIISKILEIHLFPHFLKLAERNNYRLELASQQNYYPDLTFINKDDETIKYAVDLKTTFRDPKNSKKCNGFTLGSQGEYFQNRSSRKNIQYPYSQYLGHFCFGIIYSRNVEDDLSELKILDIKSLENITSVIKDFTCFAEEKWKIASDKGGSGNTANIGSIKSIDDLMHGNGVFANSSEEMFDDYWINYGKLTHVVKGVTKKVTSFKDYLIYRNEPLTLLNVKDKNAKN